MIKEDKNEQAQDLCPELEIYDTYQNVIAPLILTLEVVDGEFPIEILNEIRSIFTHLSRYKLQEDEKELVSAQRHVKRAVLDCYKYLCVSYFEKVKKFRREYYGVDLSIADNGLFLPALDGKTSRAKKALFEAKKFEITSKQKSTETTDADQLYELYENAFVVCFELYEFLENSYSAISFASTKAYKHNVFSNISLAIGIIGLIVGFAGIMK